jgi:hypothetical protein
MAAHPGERVLAAEMIACLGIEYVAYVWKHRKDLNLNPLNLHAEPWPRPQLLLAPIFAFSALALAAMFGADAAKVAAGLGGLVTLVIVLKASTILFPTPSLAASVSAPPFASPPAQPTAQGIVV